MAKGVSDVVVDTAVGGVDVVADGIVVVDTEVFLVEVLRGVSTQPLRPTITTVMSPVSKTREHRTFPVLAEWPLDLLSPPG
jgi:hypothetical protein